jgi:hypothetical protein
MGGFFSELKPRRVLLIDEPSRHLTPRQFGVALLINALAAAFWAYVARSPVVAVLVMAQVLNIWRSPAEHERPLMRLGAAMIFGAIATAFFLVVKRLVFRQ